ncbi:MAG: metal ABC transporter solute-binding protein, Zn/Mn family [Fibrobacterota bacterium]
MKTVWYRYILFFLSAAAIMTGFACSKDESGRNETDKLIVQTDLFPLYDFARRIGGDRAAVSLILPPGVSPVSFEPSPRDMAAVAKGDIFFYLGRGLDPWAEDIVSANSANAVAVSHSISLLNTRREEKKDDHDGHGDHREHDTHGAHETEEDHDAHGHGARDPHIWLDPLRAVTMVENMRDAYIAADSAGAEIYRTNADSLLSDLKALHAAAAEKLAPFAGREILYAGHFAFGYFAQRYNLDHVSPYKGFSPNAEPSPRAIEKMIRRVNAHDAQAIFFQELIAPSIAEVIREETGAELVLLHGLHNTTSREREAGITYMETMYENIDRLVQGLE